MCLTTKEINMKNGYKWLWAVFGGEQAAEAASA